MDNEQSINIEIIQYDDNTLVVETCPLVLPGEFNDLVNAQVEGKYAALSGAIFTGNISAPNISTTGTLTANHANIITELYTNTLTADVLNFASINNGGNLRISGSGVFESGLYVIGTGNTLYVQDSAYIGGTLNASSLNFGSLSSSGNIIIDGDAYFNSRVVLKASGLATTPTQFAVFSGSPNITAKTLYTRTPSEVKTDIGLGNVTNNAQMRKRPASSDGYVPTWNGVSGDYLNTGYSIETILTGASTALPRADAVKNYVDNLLGNADALIFKGTLGNGGTLTSLPSTYGAGWTYKVITAGTYAGNICEIGDLIIAIIDRNGINNQNSDWTVAQSNLDGAVLNTRILTAGSGLVGGGDLTANRTFHIGQGDGINVTEDAIAVNSTVVRTSGATFTGNISGPSGNFTSLKVNNVDVSPSGHTHTSSNITNFNSSVSGLLPVKDIVGGTSISVSSVSGQYTISATGVAAASASSISVTCQNITGSQIPKMSVVYINGGQGNLPTITLAQANNEAKSSKTFGITSQDINNNSSGSVVVLGSLIDVNTNQFGLNLEGTTLYLSPTVSGGMTITKPSAPNHMVSIGKIVRSHNIQGVIQVNIQNGFELEELHNVAISGVSDGQFLYYNAPSGLWQPNTNIYSSGNNIGIGVTSPVAKLDIAGTLKVNGDPIFNEGATLEVGQYTIGISTYNGTINIESSTAGDGTINIGNGFNDTTNISSTFTTINGWTFDGDNVYNNNGILNTNSLYTNSIYSATNNSTIFIQDLMISSEPGFIYMDAGAGHLSISADANVNITSAVTEIINLNGNVTVGGNLTVNGSTFVTNVDTVTIEDPIITLGLASGNIVPFTNSDRGLALVRGTGLTAFMGWDTSASQFVMLSSGVSSNSSGNYDAGTYGNLQINNLNSSRVYSSRLDLNDGINSSFISCGAEGDTRFLVSSNGALGIGSAIPSTIDSAPFYISSNGSVTNGTWNASTIAVNKGGTGRTSYSNGQLLIGSGTSLVANTLTSTSGIGITNGSGTITIGVTGIPSSSITNFNSSVSGLLTPYQLALTNPVTGVGTSGYLTKWISGSGVSSGIIFDNGSGIGIGTTNPLSTLDVRGEIRASGLSGTQTTIWLSDNNIPAYKSIIHHGNFIQFNQNNVVAGYGVGIRLNNPSNVGIDSNGPNGYLALAAGGSEKVRIATDGKVGVGTTTPSGQLHVIGSGIFSSGIMVGDSSTNGYIIGPSGNTFIQFNQSSNNTIRLDSNTYSNSHAYLNTQFTTINSQSTYCNGSFQFPITNSAATSTATQRDSNPINFFNRMWNGSSETQGKSTIEVKASTTTNLLSRLAFSTHIGDGTTTLAERMCINSSDGNVGIGTASPSARLEVAASTTTSVDIAHFSNSNGVEKAKFSLSSNGDGTLSLIDGNNVTNAFLSSSSTSSSYVNGKFGIGTSTPSSQLHVIGSGIFSSGITVGNGSSNSYIYASINPNTNNVRFNYGGGDRIDFNSSQLFYNGASYFQGDNYVLRVGETTSTASQKDSYQFIFQNALWDGAASQYAVSMIKSLASTSQNMTSRLAFFTHNGINNTQVERMCVTSSGGYVGVGTTSPSVQLDVAGSGRFRGRCRVDNLTINTDTTTDNTAPYLATMLLGSDGASLSGGGLQITTNTNRDANKALLGLVNNKLKTLSGASTFAKTTFSSEYNADTSVPSTQTPNGNFVNVLTLESGNLTLVNQNLYIKNSPSPTAYDNNAGTIINSQAYIYMQGASAGSPARFNNVYNYYSRGQFAASHSYTTNFVDFYAAPIVGQIVPSGGVTTRTALLIDYYDGNTAHITNPRGIWQLGSGVTNHLAGSLGVGTTTPSSQLHVIGSGTFSNSVSVGSSTLSDSNLPSIINSTNLYLWSNFN